MLPPRLKKRATSKLNTSFITQVIIELEANPNKLEIIRHNLAYYRTQTHLKKGFLLAIERFDWVFAACNNVDEICAQIMADDYIGNRLRRYPLLFKGILAP
ncbi:MULTISPECIES: hypothetical protein [Pseudoalteromonas]|uniref:hypothetical protein n=1 Tax=Pseudoalteromonas TaxID=53246 RepID=UPI0015CCCB9F|nr:hypothetical protein [Pseudoalteromonas sp. MIP2626]NYR11402.1 hypothetical protein [Pseudoalteromonas sp. MIP2626]